jgi:molecular chaperone GrpE (heat shock protein)
MARTERVNAIAKALTNATNAIATAVGELQISMASKVAEIATLKRQLQEDNEELMDLTTVVETFAEDLSEIVGDMDEASSQVAKVLYTLDDFPSALVFVDNDEEDEEELVG